MNITTDRPFTKSVFKIALSCPTKLYYARHPETYANSNDENDFLAALAKGGFQVGELAKLYKHVDKDLHDVTDYNDALAETEDLLKRNEVVIAEAAFAYEDMFIRADIVSKNGNRIDLIEVKAKSFNPDTESWMGKRTNTQNCINSEWREYLYDLAFQKYVMSLAKPEYEIHSYLMLADKRRVADVDNLNQLFKIREVNGRTSIEINPDVQKKLASSDEDILTAFEEADEVVNAIIDGTSGEQDAFLEDKKFKDFVDKMRAAWTNDKLQEPKISKKCFKCEFCNSGQEGMKDGRDECWLAEAHFEPSKTKIPQVSELWNPSKRDEMIKAGLYYLQDLTDDWVKLEHNTKLEEGLSPSERRWLQIAIATQNKDLLADYGLGINDDVYLDCEGLKAYIREHDIKRPFHMIDFETTSVALPYYKGMHPYEEVAFQFSHHIMDINPDGSFQIEHKGQWLNEDVNAFPNFNFVRALKAQLETDDGTIFRYSNHENTILNAIKEQLEQSHEPDKDELIEFINSITHDKGRKGERDMIDLCDIVKKFYYCYSQMHGSNSIKQVLPAVLNSSSYLQNKYSNKIYGSQIPSLNIPANDPIAWISQMPDGTIDNPYHLLPSVAKYIGITQEQEWKIEENQVEVATDDMTIANGGAALMAYSKLMFCEDRMDKALRTALLRYCELDTMAMIFIWEYFIYELSKLQKLITVF